MWRVATETGTMAGPGDQTALNLGERGLHTGRPSIARVLPAAANVRRPSVPAGQPPPRAPSVYMVPAGTCIYIYAARLLPINMRVRARRECVMHTRRPARGAGADADPTPGLPPPRARARVQQTQSAASDTGGRETWYERSGVFGRARARCGAWAAGRRAACVLVQAVPCVV